MVTRSRPLATPVGVTSSASHCKISDPLSSPLPSAAAAAAAAAAAIIMSWSRSMTRAADDSDGDLPFNSSFSPVSTSPSFSASGRSGSSPKSRPVNGNRGFWSSITPSEDAAATTEPPPSAVLAVSVAAAVPPRLATPWLIRRRYRRRRAVSEAPTHSAECVQPPPGSLSSLLGGKSRANNAFESRRHSA